MTTPEIRGPRVPPTHEWIAVDELKQLRALRTLFASALRIDLENVAVCRQAADLWTVYRTDCHPASAKEYHTAAEAIADLLGGPLAETLAVTAENVDIEVGDLAVRLNGTGFGTIELDGEPLAGVYEMTIRAAVGQATTATIDRYCHNTKGDTQ